MRLLIVEDYAPLRNSLSRGLREAGFAVDVAANGNDAQRLIAYNPYDVIVLDLMLPGIDGLTLLRGLRNKHRPAHVLILTAKDSVKDRINGLNLGADDYLIKPFDFQELLARVRALVRRKYDSKEPVIRIGDLTINTVSKIVTRGERIIDLTAREYALLEFLALRCDEVVTRTAIWESVYELNSDPDSNVVDVYIGYLRKKIERPDAPRLIHTRRGLGYVLAQPPDEQP